MEISPYMLLLLLIYSFLFGMSAGVLNDVNRIIRIVMRSGCGSERFAALYEKELAFIGKLSASGEKKRLRRGIESVIIFLQDILLFAYLGCGVVILNYYLNRGQFRLYTIAAVAVGLAVYYFTVGRLVIFISEGIVFFLRAAVRLTFYVLSRPFVELGRFARNLLKKLYKKIKSAIAKKRIIRYNKNKREELLSLALNGFEQKSDAVGGGKDGA